MLYNIGASHILSNFSIHTVHMCYRQRNIYTQVHRHKAFYFCLTLGCVYPVHKLLAGTRLYKRFNRKNYFAQIKLNEYQKSNK